MTPTTWIALAAAAAVLALPSRSTVRLADLAGAGRVHGRARSGRRPRPVAVPSAVGVAGIVPPVLVVALLAGPVPAVSAGALLTVAVVLGRDAVRRRAELRHHRRVLTAVQVLAGELAAGSRPPDALAAAAATSPAAHQVLGPAADVARRAGDTAAALAEVPDDGVRGLAAAWRLAETTGAAPAEVVERVAADLASRAAHRQAVAVALAGPRASAVLVGALPAIGIVLGVAMGAHPVEFLLGDPVGRLLCCAGVLLDAAGVLWIRAVVARVERA